MSSLPTHSAAILMHGPLMTISHFLAASASLDESCTLMEVLISMLSAISPGNFDLDDPMFLMLRAATLTLNHLEEGRRAVTTMRSKMEMWSLEGSSGRAEEEFTKMCLRGALLSVRKVRGTFGNVLHDWIRVRCAPTTTHFEHMQTGATNPPLYDTNIPPGSNLNSEWYLSWLAGERSLLELIGNEVRPCGADHVLDLGFGQERCLGGGGPQMPLPSPPGVCQSALFRANYF
ncbi:putative ORF3 protein [Giant panda associated gemycircularvirus]|uniref:Putative ORF3 protein n=1 Tax=Giant panda associated gemycircularvirus TaxID=2016461 RepID=A0A220IGR7_9VIRU|nr:putative ORF3 protein [Giant panda associated gemycircularvirus]ASH99168.1 putative ORF3 protein [Giant panda associated gemycircularvirus]